LEIFKVNNMSLAHTPEPPYYAAIFSSVRTDVDEGYYAMNDTLFEALSTMPGYLGHESAREEVGITVSYWSDLESLRNWKELPLHRKAQALGREKWYSAYKVRICKVERAYGFEV
jgi:heme-degrading monooxygenase HmoA